MPTLKEDDRGILTQNKINIFITKKSCLNNLKRQLWQNAHGDPEKEELMHEKDEKPKRLQKMTS